MALFFCLFLAISPASESTDGVDFEKHFLLYRIKGDEETYLSNAK